MLRQRIDDVALRNDAGNLTLPAYDDGGADAFGREVSRLLHRPHQSGCLWCLISMIACYEGLGVRGEARVSAEPPPATVVKSIVALIATDCVFTGVFYLFGL